MRAGADVIYQACFVDGDWRGFADFVERQAGRPVRGRRHEARAALEAGVRASALLLLRAGRADPGVDARADARRARERASGRRFGSPTSSPTTTGCASGSCRAVEAGIDVYPLPVSYCDRCDFQCAARHGGAPTTTSASSLGCGATRLGGSRLWGSRPSRELARAADEARPRVDGAAYVRDAARPGGDAGRGAHRRPRLEGARRRSRRAGSSCCRRRPPATSSSTSRATRSGSRRAGSSTSGGSSTRPGAFTPFWAHDRAQERRAVEGVIDLIRERRAAHPAMHVYHYAAYELTALKRLTCEYGTREDELDDLLRGEVFVDLYKVVSQGAPALARALRAQAGRDVLLRAQGRPAGGRRLDRALRGLPRAATTRASSTRSPPTTRRTASRRSGCATGSLDLRPGPAPPPERARAAPTRPTAPPRPRSSGGPPRRAPRRPPRRRRGDRPRWLLAQLLLYHRREEKPVWWEFFDRIGLTAEELQERDSDAIGGLEPAGPPIGSGRVARLAVHASRRSSTISARATTSSTRRPGAPLARSTRSTRSRGR